MYLVRLTCKIFILHISCNRNISTEIYNKTLKLFLELLVLYIVQNYIVHMYDIFINVFRRLYFLLISFDVVYVIIIVNIFQIQLRNKICS